MESRELLRALKRKFNVHTDSGLAKIIGVTPPSITSWRNKNTPLTPLQVANIVFKAKKQSSKEANEKVKKMKGVELVNSLKKKFDIGKNKALASKLGINEVYISSWKKYPPTSKQIASVIANAYKQGEKDSLRAIIKPLLEYYPIIVSESTHGKKQEIFETKENLRNKKIKELLQTTNGIYIFYSSQRRAIYVGKAKEVCLWNEIKNAYNRDRRAQTVWGVNHPSTGNNFKPAHRHPRKVTKQSVYLHDIALYFSAYEVERNLINTVEAMLIRAFANELTNTRMENLSATSKTKSKK